jgi:hypothetical protein
LSAFASSNTRQCNSVLRHGAATATQTASASPTPAKPLPALHHAGRRQPCRHVLRRVQAERQRGKAIGMQHIGHETVPCLPATGFAGVGYEHQSARRGRHHQATLHSRRIEQTRVRGRGRGHGNARDNSMKQTELPAPLSSSDAALALRSRNANAPHAGRARTQVARGS